MNNTTPNTEQSEKAQQVATSRYLNISAVKKHALKCSIELRAGKFSRVGESFVDSVQAEVDRLLYHIHGQFNPSINNRVASDADASFITGAFMSRAKDAFENVVPRIIQARVQRHPSIGKTLK